MALCLKVQISNIFFQVLKFFLLLRVFGQCALGTSMKYLIQ